MKNKTYKSREVCARVRGCERPEGTVHGGQGKDPTQTSRNSILDFLF